MLLKISILRMVQLPKMGPAAVSRRHSPEQLAISNWQSAIGNPTHHPQPSTFNPQLSTQPSAFPTRVPPEQTRVCIRGVFFGPLVPVLVLLLVLDSIGALAAGARLKQVPRCSTGANRGNRGSVSVTSVSSCSRLFLHKQQAKHGARLVRAPGPAAAGPSLTLHEAPPSPRGKVRIGWLR
jgi:hypothetical protein